MSTDRARTSQADLMPRPGETEFRIRLHDVDGDPLHHFVKDGPVEVWVEASEQPVDAEGTEGLKYVLLPLAFPNFPIAHVHAEGLKRALGQLERALERAVEAAGAPIATRDDGHYHVVRFARYKRALPVVAMCTVCMCELVPDVYVWAVEHGLADPVRSSRTSFHQSDTTTRDAIEQAVNG